MVTMLSGIPTALPESPTFREVGAIHALPDDKRRSSRRAGLFAIAIGKHHAFFGESIDVGRPVAHHPMAVAAEVLNADIITP
jgi:hypothetical protein